MFKYSLLTAIFAGISTVAFASSSGDAGSLFSYDMLFKVTNFAILLFLLHKFARKPLARMLSSSAENTKKTIVDAKNELADAKRKLEEYQTKLANLETELAERQKNAMAAIEIEKQQLIADAENQVRKLEVQAQERIEQDVLKAKAEIKEFLVSESVKMAEETILKEIGSKEQKALFDNYAKFIKETA